MWKLNNILLNKQLIKEEITREIRKYVYFEMNENENTTCQSSKSSAKRDIYTTKCLQFKKKEKVHIKNLIVGLVEWLKWYSTCLTSIVASKKKST
jgi:hypothetical protein